MEKKKRWEMKKKRYLIFKDLHYAKGMFIYFLCLQYPSRLPIGSNANNVCEGVEGGWYAYNISFLRELFKKSKFNALALHHQYLSTLQEISCSGVIFPSSFSPVKKGFF